MSRILVTGSEGLIGRALRRRLSGLGHDIVGFDCRALGAHAGDVRDAAALSRAVMGCDGIVHLAAVSRVLAAQRDPKLCWAVNVGGVENLLEAATRMRSAPWIVFASSREVYGNPQRLPVDENACWRPLNTYAQSKVAGEQLVAAARRRGLRAATVRFSNVYGSAQDHADRVVPAFARAAVDGGDIVVRGGVQRLDFTHVDDVSRGVAGLIALLSAGAAPPPPIHFASGRGTSLMELAQTLIGLGGRPRSVSTTAPSGVHAQCFVGNARRAWHLLGWMPEISLECGLRQLMAALRGQPSSFRS